MTKTKTRLMVFLSTICFLCICIGTSLLLTNNKSISNAETLSNSFSVETSNTEDLVKDGRGTFEKNGSANLAGWSDNVTAVADSENGGYYGRFTSGEAIYNFRYDGTGDIAVSPKETYHISYRYKIVSISGGSFDMVIYYNANSVSTGLNASRGITSSETTATGGWKTFDFDLVIPKETENISSISSISKISLRINGGSGEILFDDFSMKKVADADHLNLFGYCPTKQDYAADGNGTFQTGNGGTSAVKFGDAWYADVSVSDATGAEAYGGVGVSKKGTGTNSAHGFRVNFASNANKMEVQKGVTYTLSFMYKLVGGTPNFKPLIQFLVGSTAYGHYEVSNWSNIRTACDWTFGQCTFAVPDAVPGDQGSIYIRDLKFQIGATTAYIDNISIVKGDNRIPSFITSELVKGTRGSFDDGTTTAWSDNVTAVADSENGGYYGRFTSGEAKYNFRYDGSDIAVSPKETYHISYRYKIVSISGGSFDMVIYYNGGSESTGLNATRGISSNETKATDGWKTFDFDLVIPNGKTSVSQISLRINGGSGEILFDDFSMKKVADADHLNLFGYCPTKTDYAGQGNGTFETGNGGSSAVIFGDWYQYADVTGAEAYGGKGLSKKSTADPIRVNFASSADKMEVQKGVTYTLSFMYKLVGGTPNFKPLIQFLVGSTAYGHYEVSNWSNIRTACDWTFGQCTFAVPDAVPTDQGPIYIRELRWQTGSTTAYIDNISVVKGNNLKQKGVVIEKDFAEGKEGYSIVNCSDTTNNILTEKVLSSNKQTLEIKHYANASDNEISLQNSTMIAGTNQFSYTISYKVKVNKGIASFGISLLGDGANPIASRWIENSNVYFTTLSQADGSATISVVLNSTETFNNVKPSLDIKFLSGALTEVYVESLKMEQGIVVAKNIGSISSYSTYAIGDVITLGTPDNVVEGFTFDHWIIDNKSYGPDAQITVSSSMTINAFFIPNEYTLSFSADEVVAPITVVYDNDLSNLPVIPNKVGSEALGWFIGETRITEDTIWNYTENKTAVARYQPISNKEAIKSNSLINNGEFSNGVNGWSGGGLSSIDGKLVSSSAVTETYYQFPAPIEVQAGEIYQLRFEYKVEGEANFRIKFTYINSSDEEQVFDTSTKTGANYNNGYFSSVTSSCDWTTAEMPIVCWEGMKAIKLITFAKGGNTTLYLDNVSFEKTAEAGYGNLFSTVYMGNPDGGQSGNVRLICGGGTYQTANGGLPWHQNNPEGAYGVVGASLVSANDDANVFGGFGYSVKNTTGGEFFQYVNSAYRPTLKAGTTYLVSFMYKLVGGSGAPNFGPKVNYGGNAYTLDGWTNKTSACDWTLGYGTITPANDGALICFHFNVRNTNGWTTYIDNLCIQKLDSRTQSPVDGDFCNSIRGWTVTNTDKDYIVANAMTGNVEINHHVATDSTVTFAQSNVPTVNGTYYKFSFNARIIGSATIYASVNGTEVLCNSVNSIDTGWNAYSIGITANSSTANVSIRIEFNNDLTQVFMDDVLFNESKVISLLVGNSYVNYDVIIGSSFTLPKIDFNGKILVAWKDSNNRWYAEDYVLENITTDLEFTGIYIDFKTISGASIRLANSSEETGIRYTTTFDNEDYAVISSKVSEFGTLLIPTENITKTKEFKIENFEENSQQLSKYIKRVPSSAYDEGIALTGKTSYMAGYKKMKQESYSQPISARGYMIINYDFGGDGEHKKFIYTNYDSIDNSRTIEYVATMFSLSSEFSSISEIMKGIVNVYKQGYSTMFPKLSETIKEANATANNVQANYNSASRTQYIISNNNMNIVTGLNPSGSNAEKMNLTSITNKNGNALLQNTVDMFVTYNGTKYYVSQNGIAKPSEKSIYTNYNAFKSYARVNTTKLGYYYYETYIRDMALQANNNIRFEKAFYTYADKVHQSARVLAYGSDVSGVTNFGYETKVSTSGLIDFVFVSDTKTINGIGELTASPSFTVTNAKYVGFRTANGVVGYIFPEGISNSVTVSYASNTITISQFVNNSATLTKPTENANVNLRAEGKYLQVYNRLYVDSSNNFEGLELAYDEEYTADDVVISVESNDHMVSNGYDKITGAFKFTMDGYQFDTASADPNKKFSGKITVSTSDMADVNRKVYINVNSKNTNMKYGNPVEGSVILDQNGQLVPIPVQVSKNFYNEVEEPVYDPLDYMYGNSIIPVTLKKSEAIFQVVQAYEKWGDYRLKQISSISFNNSYYHESLGVEETNCTVPYFSLYENSSLGRGYFFADFRGASNSQMPGDIYEKSSGAKVYLVQNNNDSGEYVSTKVNNSGMTYTDIVYNYKTNNYDYSVRHVEMPQTDETRTYLTIDVTFTKKTTISKANFSLLGLTSNEWQYKTLAYLNTSGAHTTVTDLNKGTKKYAWSSETYPSGTVSLKSGASYFAFYNIDTSASLCRAERANVGFVIKDYFISTNGTSNSGRALAVRYSIDKSYSNLNNANLTLSADTTFEVGGKITINLILVSFGTNNQTNCQNIINIYNDSAVNQLNFVPIVGTVESDGIMQYLVADKNSVEFTVKGGTSANTSNVNYVVLAKGFTKLGKPILEKYNMSNGQWEVVDYTSSGEISGTDYDGYGVAYENNKLTYSFVITKGLDDAQYRIGFPSEDSAS